MVNKIYTTQNSNETRALGKQIGKTISLSKSGPKVLCLYGELGAGKTTFIQGLAEGLGIVKRILSPTFILMRQYAMRNSKTFYHLDCYRLEKVEDLGLSDIIKDEHNIIAIEWAEKTKDLLPNKRTDIYFERVGENKRKIILYERH